MWTNYRYWPGHREYATELRRLANGIERPKDMQKKQLHTITQEQVVMRYNEHLVIPRFRHIRILFGSLGYQAKSPVDECRNAR
jgi:hypothetical protein